MTLRALIFDVDGTLADTEEAHRQSFNAAFVKHELPWHWGRRVYAELLRIAGGRERLAHFVDLIDIPAEARSRLQRQIAAIYQEKTRIYTRFVAEGRVSLRDGVERLIFEARTAGVRLAIATATSLANVEALITHTLGESAMEWFDAIAADDAVARKKPAPDVYRLALEMLGLPAADCIAIEDSSNGVIAAKHAGLYTVATPTAWTADHDLSAADRLLPSLAVGGSFDELRFCHLHTRLDRGAAA